MSGIMTNVYLGIVLNGRVERIPLLNTKEYFDESLCFAVKHGNRILYLPAKTNPVISSFPRSICFCHNNQKHYFITSNANLYKSLMVSISLRQTYSGRTGTGGYLDISVGGQILGVTFKLHFSHKSGDSCCEDFDVTVNAGNAFVSKEVILGNTMINFREIKTVTCDISNYSFDIDIHAGADGYIWYNDFYFDLSE